MVIYFCSSASARLVGDATVFLVLLFALFLAVLSLTPHMSSEKRTEN